MKKHLYGKKLIVAGLLAMVMLSGCSKEVNSNVSLVGPEESGLLQSPGQITDTSSILHFLNGTFFAQVNTITRTDSSTLIFDFIVLKKFQKVDSKRISVAYGDPQFAERGWKYEIAVDPVTQEIRLSPNDLMAAGIVHGSFQTVSATFDRASRIFNFVTRFKELNGNKNEVGETLSK
jgi:hypothetical protein